MMELASVIVEVIVMMPIRKDDPTRRRADNRGGFMPPSYSETFIF